MKAELEDEDVAGGKSSHSRQRKAGQHEIMVHVKVFLGFVVDVGRVDL